MKTALSYQSCFVDLYRYILHKQQWELLPSPTQMHQNACLKNLKTGKVYKVMERNTPNTLGQKNQLPGFANLPQIFLKVVQINEQTYLMEKPCRSLATVNFQSLNRKRNFFSEEEIKNTLAPIFKSLIDQNFPFEFQIRRENIVVDYFGKVRFINPLFASQTHHQPNLRLSVLQLVFLLIFGYQVQARVLDELCSEEGYSELVENMKQNLYSDEFIVFVVALLHFPITKAQLETYASFVEGFQNLVGDQKVVPIREWVSSKIEGSQRGSDEDREQIEKIQTSKFQSEKKYSEGISFGYERTEVKRNLQPGPHGSKYRNGIRLKEPQYSSSDDEGNSFFSRSLSKTQLTEQDSRTYPQNISM